MTVSYTAVATSSGGGRDGQVRSSDAQIDQPVRMPTAMGGDGQGTNPEQLFAAAYATCFHGVLRLTARNTGVAVPDDATVDAEVGIGPDETSFGITATLTVHLPGLDQSAADDLVQQAHQVCPYSKVTRGNLDVTLKAKV